MKRKANHKTMRKAAVVLAVIALILSVSVLPIGAAPAGSEATEAAYTESTDFYAAETTATEAVGIDPYTEATYYVLPDVPAYSTADSSGESQISAKESTDGAGEMAEVPQTGDSTMSGFFIGLGALALGGLVAGLILFLKRRKDDGDDD